MVDRRRVGRARDMEEDHGEAALGLRARVVAVAEEGAQDVRPLRDVAQDDVRRRAVVLDPAAPAAAFHYGNLRLNQARPGDALGWYDAATALEIGRAHV